jgi:hypothetical protein
MDQNNEEMKKDNHLQDAPDLLPGSELPEISHFEQDSSKEHPEEINQLEETKQDESSIKKPEKEEPTKTQKFFRKAFIWFIVVLIAFGSGFLLDHFLRYIPLKQDLDQAQSEIQALNQELDTSDGQLEQLRPKLEAANAKISSLEDDLEMANARTQLYQVLASVNNARLDLFQEDIEAAQTDLVQTEQHLEELAPVIEDADPELALSLLRRLELIVDGLERDSETASIDLELFTKDLLALEPLLFAE